MTTRPYELLARFAADGTVAGVSVRTITTVDGRDFESDPQPLSGTDDPSFTSFAEQFAAAAATELARVKAERDELAASLAATQALLNDQNSVTRSITPRQAKLALYNAGLLDEVETLIARADRVVQIHYNESVVWLRNDPVLNGLASQLGMTSEQLDALFVRAAQL